MIDVKFDKDLKEHMDKLLEAFDQLTPEIRRAEFANLELSKITMEQILKSFKLGTPDEIKRQCEKSLLLADVMKNLNTYLEMSIAVGIAEIKKDIDK